MDFKSLLRRQSLEQALQYVDGPGKSFKKQRTLLGITMLSIAAIIGTGVWTVTGPAAAGAPPTSDFWDTPLMEILIPHGVSVNGRSPAGPSVTVSYSLAAIACVFSAICFAELASKIPAAGSSYTWSYVAFGEIFAWIVGWDLILEFAVSNMATAVGFTDYLMPILRLIVDPEESWWKPYKYLVIPAYADGKLSGGFNLPPFLLVAALTSVLLQGIKENERMVVLMVLVKLAAIVGFVGFVMCLGKLPYWNLDRPQFAPGGVTGILSAAPLVFFTFIGFDSVTTTAEECENPRRDIPLGIIFSLLACVILYILVAVVMTGGARYQELGRPDGVEVVLKNMGYSNLAPLISIPILVGIGSSVLAYQIGLSRILMVMSRDGLLPGRLSHEHPTRKIPDVSTVAAGIIVAIPAGIWDFKDLLSLANIGTLFSFIIVCSAVGVLRRMPSQEVTFRVPCAPVVSIAGIVCCLLLMVYLPVGTWIRFICWLALGLIIYFSCARYQSRLAR